MVHTTEKDTSMAQSLSPKTDEKRQWVASDIVETMQNQLFCIMVVITSKVPVTLLKDMKIGQLSKALSMIMLLKNIMSDKPVNDTLVYSEKQIEDQQFAHHQQMTMSDKKKRQTSLRNQISFN